MLLFLYFSLQVTSSDQRRVVLDDVRSSLSGTYMCEVTVSPSFYTLMEYANMTVVGEQQKLSKACDSFGKTFCLVEAILGMRIKAKRKLLPSSKKIRC